VSWHGMTDTKMLNLKKQSGISATFEDNMIAFGKDIVSEPVRTRTLEDVRPYLMHKDATSRRKNFYLMYRDPHRTQDEAVFRQYGIRYDITVLFPGTIGGKKGEYVKTIGHTHSAAELYEVLHGTALFVLQEIAGENRIFFIKATKGEKVIIPPEFGHITTNISDEPLILADLFQDSVKSDYSFFKEHQGAAYWVSALGLSSDTKDNALATEGITLTQNTKHKNVGEVIMGTPAEYTGLSKKTPIYTAFVSDPKQFSFLLDPKKAWKILDEQGLCYAEWKEQLA